ncbi:unnamed protein product [Auanema sp. JU1783]|nr:unnamed protein product [Auanema sp. JU1783]
MGSSQSANRAAKFSGARRRVRACSSAPATGNLPRRQPSLRNTNRSVKEFSKFWSDGGSVRTSRRCKRSSSSHSRSSSVRRTRGSSMDPDRLSPRLGPLPTPRSPRRDTSRSPEGKSPYSVHSAEKFAISPSTPIENQSITYYRHTRQQETAIY